MLNISYERASLIAHWPISVSAQNSLTKWRNAEGCSSSEKFVRRIGVEFGYAGLVITGIVEAIVKAVFTLVFLSGAAIPNLRQKSIHLACQSAQGIFFSLFSSIVSSVSLIQNPVTDQMFDNVPF
ncbi:MAG: hypothetical protein K1000chlam2_00223 [Chlamydiae bacterium]|nr:hypothetical protein [Chlamydiota bacterium]